METAIEIVSPLSHRDTDCVCRVAKMPGLVATCTGCGETVYRRVHLPLIAFGFWCSRCCPCRTFVATPEEAEALRANRLQDDAGGKGAPVPKPVKPVITPQERRARFKQRMADAARARWADPVARAVLMEWLKKASNKRWALPR